MALWVDDLDFSNRSEVEFDQSLIEEVIATIEFYGLKVSRHKTRIYSENSPNEITGLVIMHDGEIRLPNRLHKEWYLTKETCKTVRGKARKRLIQKRDSLKRQLDAIRKSNRRYRANQGT